MVELTGEDVTHLAAFRARLSATRPAKSQGDAVRDMAVKLGTKGIAGIAPVLFRRDTRILKRAAGDGEGREFVFRPAHMPVMAEGTKSEPDTVPALRGFRAVLAAARQEAAQGRARRERERVTDYLPPPRDEVTQRRFAPMRRGAAEAMPHGAGGHEPLAAPAFVRSASRIAAAGQGRRGTGALPLAVSAAVGRGAAAEVMCGEVLEPVKARPVGREEGEDLERALRTYFFRQSRLPPSGGVGFDSRLTPTWAGVKIPG